MPTDQRERARAKLAASFVVMVAGACTKSGAPPEPRPESTASIVSLPDGSCRWHQSMSCPENATCNPPPPRELDCPPDKRPENSRVLPEHDRRPPGKEGWLRFHESFWVGNTTCSYTSDQLCPPIGQTGTCVGAKSLEVPCPPEPGVHLPRTIPAFKAERAAGGCVLYPEFRCESGGCELPAPAFVDCSAPLPPPEEKAKAARPFQGNVFKDPRGACQLIVSPSCPPGATCNPPPPAPIDCPPAQRDEAGPTGIDDERPPGKEGWLRLKPSLYASDSECSYQLDRFCPKPGSEGNCDAYESVKVPCSTRDGRVHVPAFEAPRAAGRCFAYAATSCEPHRACELPGARVVACKAEVAR